MSGSGYNTSARTDQEGTADVMRYILYGKERNSQSAIAAAYRHLPVPPQVYVSASSTPGDYLGIFAAEKIKTGTQMGPFVGRILPNDVKSVYAAQNCAWEIYDREGNIKSFVIGSTDIGLKTSWLSYIKSARHDREQNLDVVQIGNEIFYKASKDIPVSEELLVWYGNSYNLYFGIPDTRMKNRDCELLTNKGGGRRSKLICVVCRKGFNSRSNLRSHMRIHTRDKPFVCRFCHKKFSQSSTLRNHIRLHTGEKPYRCEICCSTYSQLAGLRAHQKSSRHRPATIQNQFEDIK